MILTTLWLRLRWLARWNPIITPTDRRRLCWWLVAGGCVCAGWDVATSGAPLYSLLVYVLILLPTVALILTDKEGQ